MSFSLVSNVPQRTSQKRGVVVSIETCLSLEVMLKADFWLIKKVNAPNFPHDSYMSGCVVLCCFKGYSVWPLFEQILAFFAIG